MNTRQHDTTTSRPTRVQKTPRIYTCSVCQRQFKRSEHCSRHERGRKYNQICTSHTSPFVDTMQRRLLDTHEKPFPCRLCGRRYARKDVVIRHEKSFHRLENPRRQPPPPIQSSSPDADADSEPFADSIVVNSHNHSTDFQVPIKLEQQETPEMQSTLDPLLREHDAQLAGHSGSSGSSGSHMNGHGAPNHGFQQYQNGFIDPALDISDLFGPSPNIITRT